jgi:hypothetical protein
MKIKKDTRVYLSELGAKGFLYPSDTFIVTSEIVNCELIPFLYSKEYGLTPVKVAAKIGEEDISRVESAIFWVDREKISE